MTVVALTCEDQKGLMEALESQTPAVRKARLAHALLLLAKGVPAVTVADDLFLPEAPVSRHLQALMLDQSTKRGVESRDSSSEGGRERRARVTRAPQPPEGCSGRRRWVQDLHGTLAR
jgi:hypothetical protein